MIGIAIQFAAAEPPTLPNRSVSEPAKTPAAVTLVVVTDNDFLSDQSAWCDSSLRRVVSRLSTSKDASLNVRYHRAGPPAILNQGRSLPPRVRKAICFLVDEQNAILDFCVGIPDARYLDAMWEDADELVAIASLNSGEAKAKLASEYEAVTRRRAEATVTRHYRSLIKQIDSKVPFTENASRLRKALMADVSERFLIDLVKDRPRWDSIQQHGQARRYWCAALLPGLVGRDFSANWPEVAQVIWRARPWQTSPEIESELNRWAEKDDGRPLILHLESQIPWLGLGFLGVTPAPPERQDTEPDRRMIPTDLCRVALFLDRQKMAPVSLRGRASKQSARWAVVSPERDKIEWFTSDTHPRFQKFLSLR